MIIILKITELKRIYSRIVCVIEAIVIVLELVTIEL